MKHKLIKRALYGMSIYPSNFGLYSNDTSSDGFFNMLKIPYIYRLPIENIFTPKLQIYLVISTPGVSYNQNYSLPQQYIQLSTNISGNNISTTNLLTTNNTSITVGSKERKLYKDINPNCRDLGGLGNISYGKMFRGGLYGGDLKKINNLGITHEITVTGNKRHIPVPESNRFGGDWRHLSDKLKGDVLSKCMQWVVDGHKVYIHCDRGCDRTGVFCAILEGILGAPREDIISDFKLSDASGKGYKISHPDATINGYLKRYGGNSSNTQQQQLNFMDSVSKKYGVDKNLMLQFIKASTNNGGVISAKKGTILIFNPKSKTSKFL